MGQPMAARAGFVEFVEAASGSLRGTAYLICGDWDRVDDVMQDALCKIYVAWPRIDRADNVFAYARRLVVNTAIDSGRRPWRREQVREELPEQPVADSSAEQAQRDLVLRALATLPPRQRACVVLRYYQDLSVDQTADALGCSPGTVKGYTSRAMTSLRPLLESMRSTGRVS